MQIGQLRLSVRLAGDDGVQIDKKKVSLALDIKAFGSYEAEVRLYPGIAAKMYVMVTEE